MIADALHSTIEEYMDGVTSGDIVACKLVRAAVDRQRRDLSRQSTPEFPYHYCERTAAKVCRFYSSVLRHSIGRYAGMPFDLEPWQLFSEATLFGWLRDADETRRFRTSYESVGRKNGKSTRAAGRAIYMAGFDNNPIAAARQSKSFLPEPVAQVVLCATKREQVDKVVYAELERMRRRSASVRKQSSDAKRQIKFYGNDGLIMTTGSDKPYDGLNPHHVVMDEIHAWRDFHREFYDTMVTGSGYRDQPLISHITTAGDDQSHLWQEIYGYARSVVLGEIEDDSYFAFIAELDEEDDPLDEANWPKANPNIGVSVSWEYLREQARKATTPITLNRFLRYHGNRKVSHIEKAFDLEKWDACAGELSDWHEADALGGGVDLGARDDLGAWALVARFPLETVTDEEGNERIVYRYELRVEAYIAADTERDLKKPPFVTWVYDERLKVCRFPTTHIKADLIEQCEEYGVHAVAYDPYNAQQFGDDLTEEGITAARMAQNYSMQNEPIREFMEAIKDGRLTHDGNPLLRWSVDNAVIAKDRQERWMLDKRDSSDKIDPVVAAVMAFRMAAMAPERTQGALYL